MSDIFDDGLSAEELAMALSLADELAEEEKERLRLLREEKEPLVPNENAPLWFEKE